MSGERRPDLEAIYAEPWRLGRGAWGRNRQGRRVPWAVKGCLGCLGTYFVGFAVLYFLPPALVSAGLKAIKQWCVKHRMVEDLLMGLQLLLLFLVCAVFVAVWRRQERKTFERGGQGAHGSARWARLDEIVTARAPRWVVPLWCSYDGTARPWRRSETRGLMPAAGLAAWAPPEGDAVCGHYLLIGATGSGKGAGILSHVLRSSRVPTLYQDVKGECPHAGRGGWSLALRWGCAAEGGPESLRWNPLRECLEDPEPEDAFLTLASLLLPDNPGEDASWVIQIARPILAELLMSGEWPTLGDFATTVRGMPLREILERGKMPGGIQGLMGGRNVPEYVSAAFLSNLAQFRMGWGRRATEGHDFTLDEMIDRGGYVLSAEPQDARRAPLRLFWAMLLRRLARSSRPRPCNLVMDEARAAGRIPNVVDALVTLRSRRVSIWMSFQSEAAVASVYPREEAEALIDAFGTRITLLHGISARDAKQLSENMRNWSKRREGQGSVNLGRSPSITFTGGSSDITAMPLMSAEDIETRGRMAGERWAVIAGRAVSLSGHPLLIQTVDGLNG